MHPVERKRNDPGALLRAEQGDIVARAQRGAQLCHQSCFVGMDGIEPDGADIVRRHAEPDCLDDRRRPRFEPLRRRGIGGAGKADPVNHRAAALPGRHGLQQFGPAPQRTDPGRAVELVGREGIKITAQRRDIDGQTRHGLAAIQQQLCADCMGQFRRAACVQH